MSQINRPIVILAEVPKNTPRPAPKLKETVSSSLRPPVTSKRQARIAAPAQEPRSVPSRGMGIKKVPIMAPVIAPIMAPSEPLKRAPAFFAPTTPLKNSINSPRIASTVMIISV